MAGQRGDGIITVLWIVGGAFAVGIAWPLLLALIPAWLAWAGLSDLHDNGRLSARMTEVLIALICLPIVVAGVAGTGYWLATRDWDQHQEVDPNTRDSGCHRQALAWASNNEPGFEWNKSGMDAYQDEYDACLRLRAVLGE